MSAPVKDYQPLLASSEDESQVCSGDWRRRFAMNREKSRSACKMRGAAYVMHLWPGQLSSTLYNCWVVLFVVFFMFTMMFGALMTLSTLPNKQLPYDRELVKVEAKRSHLHKETLKLNTVYCPVIKNENFDLNKYVTSFAYLRERFPMYRYNVIVLVDDTNETTAKDNNVLAMNTVLNRSRDKNRDRLAKEIEHLVSGTKNLSIKVQTLADFMNDSPLKKNWKRFSKKIMPLLIQSVAIWQSGGIALNLNALVGKKSNMFKRYIEKVLRDFPKEDQTTHAHVNPNYAHRHAITLKPKEFITSRKPINNIRDVIDNLKSNHSPAVMQANLMGEESKIFGITARKTKRSLSVIHSSKILIDNNKETERHQLPPSNHTNASGVSNKSKINHKTETKLKKHKSFLHKFLKIMLNASHTNANKRNLTTTTKKMDHTFLPKNTNINLSQKRESVPPKSLNYDKKKVDIITLVHNSTSKIHDLEHNANKGNIMKKFLENASNDHKVQNTVNKEISRDKSPYEKNVRLFLDMRGELIATKASCHPFIGHIFSTIQKYPTANSVTKLIDKTLKTFCVVPSNCIGIRLFVIN